MKISKARHPPAAPTPILNSSVSNIGSGVPSVSNIGSGVPVLWLPLGDSSSAEINHIERLIL